MLNAAGPLGDDEFARLMAPFAPFERAPDIAVAVSGGADSLCLAWLAGRWARARGGRAAGLVVDHRLRPEAAAEAAATARRLTAFGLAARILRPSGAAPRRATQAAARTVRYALLTHACRDAGALHLLVGHHAGDQAETVALRRAAGSGPAGLAGMAAVVERDGVRLLRPLLAVPGQRLRDTLTALGQSWIEDPSNRDPAYARTRVRRALAGRGGGAEPAETRERGRRRAALEVETAAVLRGAVRLDPRGAAVVDRARLAGAREPAGLTALARVACCVGGRVHPPRGRRLARALAALRGGGGAAFTLGGCRFVPDAGRVIVAREAIPIPDLPLAAGAAAAWDGRFAVALGAGRAAAGLCVRRLDDRAWSVLRRRRPRESVPPLLRPGLPALHDLDGPVALPHLSLRRGARAPFAAAFRPLRPLAAAPFAPAADFG